MNDVQMIGSARNPEPPNPEVLEPFYWYQKKPLDIVQGSLYFISPSQSIIVDPSGCKTCWM